MLLSRSGYATKTQLVRICIIVSIATLLLGVSACKEKTQASHTADEPAAISDKDAGESQIADEGLSSEKAVASDTTTSKPSAAIQTDTAQTKAATPGRVVYFEEQVTLTRNKALIPLTIGCDLKEGDVLATGTNGNCEIELPGIGVLKISYSTTLRIDGFHPTEKRAAVSVLKGTLLAKINKLAAPDSFVVRGGTTVCGVRGTVFSVEKTESGAFNLAVLEGTVSVFPDSLLTSGLHPAANLIADAAQQKTGGDSLKISELPTITAGQSVEVPDAAFSGKDLVSATKSARTTAGDQANLLLKIKKAIPSVQILPDSRKQQLQVFLTETPPKKTEQLKVSEIKMADYSYSWIPIDSPDQYEDPAAYWPRPYAYQSTAVSQSVIAKSEGSNTVLTINPAVTKKPLARFENGRVFVNIPEAASEWWAVIIEPRSRVRLEKGHLYSAEFTAWSPTGSMPLRFNINEGGKDKNKDGDIFTSYTSDQQILVGKNPQHYSLPYLHKAETDTTAVINVQLGQTAGTVMIQDIELRELPQGTVTSESGTGPQIPNGDFSRGFLYWTTQNFETFDPLLFSITKGTLVYTSAVRMALPWHAQLSNVIQVKKNQVYTLSFDASIEGDGLIEFSTMEQNIDINKDGNKFSNEAPSMQVNLTAPGWQRYSIEFKSFQTDPNARLIVDFGNIKGKVSVDNIVLAEKK